MAESAIARSYMDKFDIGSLTKFNTHAAPGTTLKKSVKGDEVFHTCETYAILFRCDGEQGNA
jgi:hypothetical protein